MKHEFKLVKGRGNSLGVELCPHCGYHKWRAQAVDWQTFAAGSRVINLYKAPGSNSWQETNNGCVNNRNGYYAEK